MRIGLIGIDFDGTLLNGEGKVSPRTFSAVHRVIDAGVAVIFATGRNYTESQRILLDIDHRDIAVFVGGAVVMDTKTRTMLHRRLMSPDLAREVCAYLEAAGQCALALQDHMQTEFDYVATRDVPLNESTRFWMDTTAATVELRNDLSRYHHEHTLRVGLVAASDESRKVEAGISEAMKDRVVVQSIHVPHYGVDVLEVFDPKVDKYAGLMDAAKLKGVDESAIMAIGDDINDLPMIRGARVGVAMGNARPAVKAVADKVIETNDYDGLAVFLEQLADRGMMFDDAGR